MVSHPQCSLVLVPALHRKNGVKAREVADFRLCDETNPEAWTGGTG